MFYALLQSLLFKLISCTVGRGFQLLKKSVVTTDVLVNILLISRHRNDKNSIIVKITLYPLDLYKNSDGCFTLIKLCVKYHSEAALPSNTLSLVLVARRDAGQ